MFPEPYMELWNNTTDLERVSAFTPYVFIILGALVAASGIFLKGIIDQRIDILTEISDQEAKNTPPQIEVKLGSAVESDGQVILGRTLLEISPTNDVPFNARWYVSTRDNTLVSAIMTSSVEIVPAATPVYKVPVHINSDRVIDEYIMLWLRYESIHAPELGNPPHLRGEITLPFRYAEGRVYFPTSEMLDYWRRTNTSN